jgi:hypothetical protein
VGHDELEHVQAFLHNVFATVGDALHQHVDVILESHFILPDDLGLACDVVFKRDHHLSNIEGSLLAFVVGDEEEEDLVAEAS